MVHLTPKTLPSSSTISYHSVKWRSTPIQHRLSPNPYSLFPTGRDERAPFLQAIRSQFQRHRDYVHEKQRLAIQRENERIRLKMLNVRSYLDVGNSSAQIHVKKKCGAKNVKVDGKHGPKNIQDENDKCFLKNVQTDDNSGSKDVQVDAKCVPKNVQVDDERRTKNQTDFNNVDDPDEPNTQLSDGADSETKNESVLISIW